ncbi:cryptochrome/photolyase family protein [Mucilaginibacter terrae]|uniref:Deoxyribodipyrimidine photolyase-related protein n=1 Tax=Mucilaginibacter terrae TaxID=1955052 RepID=A0ABU3GSP5_9SPHI|nr:cryptochrome/photolyase family protein [Mucilaginibacter terrae]MDT3402788.1 deoxyribodipyrimidine photolyase-related protein [Mucilaginibacter terrae]
MAKTLRLILGDQLNSKHSWYKQVDNDVIYIMLEVMQEQQYVKHHIQKILAFFAAMRNFAHQLTQKGHEVIYIKLNDKANQQDFAQNIKHIITKGKIKRFEYQLPDEYRLDEQLKQLCNELDIETATANTEHFLTERFDVRDFFGDKKGYRMENFYRHMRQKLHILMQGDEPLDNRWNFDADNRKKYDGKVLLQDALVFDHDVAELKQMIDEMQVPYFGNIDEKRLEWPLSREEALKALKYFCESLLLHFGTYEDAMLQSHTSLFHSRMSFIMNVKMLSPAEVVGTVLRYYEKHKTEIALAQVEGYVRQIIGWREFMRGVYWAQMPGYEQKNFFEHQTHIPHWFWDANTKMNCLSKCIGQSLDHAWAHHIQRLMVIGNFGLLAGIHPDDMDAWYLGVYIDAIQWVEITNTRGMSQFADGGIIASKPYVASAAYINKMSDYCKNCHYDYKKKHGDRACPYNSLYWNFFDRNANKLQKNPRIGMAYVTLNKMKPDEREKIMQQAEVYLNDMNNL